MFTVRGATDAPVIYDKVGGDPASWCQSVNMQGAVWWTAGKHQPISTRVPWHYTPDLPCCPDDAQVVSNGMFQQSNAAFVGFLVKMY
jgi:hypothetical protein